MVPATRLLQFARRWFPPSTVSSVFEPLVADWQREWQAAPRDLRPLIRLRGTAAFAITMLGLTPQVVMAPLPASLSRRVWGTVLAITGGMAAMHVVITYSNWQQAPLPLAAFFLQIPRAFTFTLPFAMLAAVDAIRCHEPWPAHIQKRAAIRLLAIVTLWMVVGGGWLAPAMNHRWRSAVDSANAGQPVAALAGVEDLSSYELLTLPDHVHPLRAVMPPGQRAREIETRVSFAFLPILFLWTRWRRLTQGPAGWFVRLPITVGVAIAAYCAILARALYGSLGAAPSLGQHAGVWIMILFFTALLGHRPHIRESGAQ